PLERRRAVPRCGVIAPLALSGAAVVAAGFRALLRIRPACRAAVSAPRSAALVLGAAAVMLAMTLEQLG
ncbi:MAG: hypothetical protein ACRD0H_21145, partial [Actinomycetes bacterium]